MTQANVPRDEVAASLAARESLGREYETEIAESLADRLDHIIDQRVAERLAHLQQPTPPVSEAAAQVEVARRNTAAGVTIGSLIMAIPLSAIAGGIAGPIGLSAVLVMIMIVNVAFHLGARRSG
ncbi:hypothetical protein [Allonocardiopsis opalescens]|uniref:Uncharacterized protein n=1 Tax=Allonocardiopsis opalescens TaxID=1144618 RepID=A0A2T0Q4S8_9ACTN|nr:hypothetical protein [Allonocardiopsis opalescens]PRX98773.1 hypothetical protein CLV72_104353 [Allonocardiopsis opalescens]